MEEDQVLNFTQAWDPATGNFLVTITGIETTQKLNILMEVSWHVGVGVLLEIIV